MILLLVLVRGLGVLLDAPGAVAANQLPCLLDLRLAKLSLLGLARNVQEPFASHVGCQIEQFL